MNKEPTQFKEAYTRLVAILKEVESGEIDIDKLETQLQEAYKLIEYCNNRLQATKVAVGKLAQAAEGEQA